MSCLSYIYTLSRVSPLSGERFREGSMEGEEEGEEEEEGQGSGSSGTAYGQRDTI